MERDLTILLVEDEESECIEMTRSIDSIDGVRLIGVTNNSKKAIEYIMDHLPDAIILDLELTKGYGNGLTFLKNMLELRLKVKPYILVTTNNTSPITHEQARVLGADFIFSKYQRDYSCKNIIEFLTMMKDTIQNTLRQSGISNDMITTESEDQFSKRIRNRIITELDFIGISPKVIGRKYLIDAIQLIIKNPEPNLCSIIGGIYNKSDASIERAMQNAINKAWRCTSIEDLIFHYTARINSEKGVPTITEFIYYYADKIKNS